MKTPTEPRYKDAAKQRFYTSLLTLAADPSSELYFQGRPHRGAGHRTAFWDGYAGLKRTANVVPGTLSAVAYAAGKQFAKTSPGIAKEEVVWTPGGTRQGEPTSASGAILGGRAGLRQRESPGNTEPLGVGHKQDRRR